MSEHTPGPWYAVVQGHCVSVAKSSGPDVVSWLGFDDSDRKFSEHVANAELIARAPKMAKQLAQLQSRVAELKALLREVYDVCAWTFSDDENDRIRKALGE